MARPWGNIRRVYLNRISSLGVALALGVNGAAAVDVNVAEDEAKKAEAAILAPLPGEGYYDAAALDAYSLEAARRSPTVAMWRSLALPGWGQVYNGKRFKAGVIIGAEIYTLYQTTTRIVAAYGYRRDARAEPNGDRKKELYAAHDATVIDAEFWGWLFVGTVAYAMMDAYVDAHLADWEVKDLPADKEASPVSLSWHLTPLGVSLGLAF